MDAAKAVLVKNKIQTALQDIDPLLKIIVHGGQFGPSSVNFRIEVCEKTAEGNGVTKESTSFVKNAVANGLSECMIFQEFRNVAISNADSSFKVVGFNERCSKWPVIIEGMKTKRRYKLTVDQLKSFLTHENETAVQ